MFSVIFEVCPAQGRRDAYLALAAEIRPVLESIDGFLDNERFESLSRPGWILSHSTWRDEKAVIRWRTQARHHLTQARGRDGIFFDYHLRVGEVTGDDQPPAGLDLSQQRFDATETGAAKACTLSETAPGHEVVDLDAATPGLVAHDLFGSLTRPGKRMLLGSWASPEAAASFRAAGACRHRTVRVIRDYALRDRREAPQYFADAPPSASEGPVPPPQNLP